MVLVHFYYIGSIFFYRALKTDKKYILYNRICMLLVTRLVVSVVSAHQGNIRFNNVTPNEFPEMGYILSIYQDNQGYMWFGTYNGLYRYNGVEYLSFQFKEGDTNTISNSVVHAIVEDKSGNLWIGTEYGLNRYNPETGKFNVFHADKNKKNSILHDHARALNVDSQGIVWIGTYGGGLNWYNPATGKFGSLRKNAAEGRGFKSGRINCLARENDSILWVGFEEGGISRVNTKTFEVQTFLADSLNKLTIADIYIDINKKIWVGTWRNGLFRFHPEAGNFLPEDILPHQNWTAKSIVEDAEGNLLIGSFGEGLIRYNDQSGEKEFFVHDENDVTSLISNQLWKLFADRSKIIWIGSFGQGLGQFDKYRYKMSAFVNFNPANGGLGNKQVNAIFQSADGKIWIGTKSGLNQYDMKQDKIVSYHLPELEITMIKEGSANNLVVATTTGLFLYNPQNRKKTILYRKNPGAAVSQEHITVVKADKSNNLWFAIYDEGLFFMPAIKTPNGFKYDVGKMVQLYSETESNTNSSNIIWDIAFISETEIWLTTNKNITSYTISSGKLEPMAKFAHSVFYDKIPGVVWAGSLGQGLISIDKSTTTTKHYTTANGLASDVIMGILSDIDGNIWVSSNTGISKINPITGSVRNYDTYDGLVSRRFILHSACRLASGELLFGSDNGFTLFDPLKVKDSPYLPNVKVTDIKLFNKSITYEKASGDNKKMDKPLDGTDMVELSYRDNTITIGFVALCFSAPEKVKYAYMLEGFDSDWIYTDFENRTATYTNLDGGEYVFKVKATNADEVWSDKISSLKLTITPPFWKLPLFRATMLFFAFGLVLLFYRNRVQTIKQNALKKYNDEKIKREREISALNNEKLDVELEFKKKELASSTLDIIRKNEELTKLHDELVKISHDVMPKNRARIQKLIKEIENSIDDINQWEYFEKNFNVLHGDFLKRFASDFPKLTNKDLKICAFIRMNFDNKEIARTLNITIESLGVSRTRIRKKIGLDKDLFLNDYILRY